jgi:sec-independent protein translocase protein TatA
MGLGGISFGSLLLIFLIVIVLFGTKKLRNVGEDLGHAVRNFRKGLQEPDVDTKKIEEKESTHQ